MSGINFSFSYGGMTVNGNTKTGLSEITGTGAANSTSSAGWDGSAAGSGNQSSNRIDPPSDSISQKIGDPDLKDLIEEQKRMQKENQLFSSLTNNEKVKHDTRKAAIQNFRVT